MIITTTAPDEAGRIHDRLPMVIDPAQWGDWLDPANNDPSRVHPLLVPAAASGLVSYPVGIDVNYVRNNGPGLIKPLDPSTGDTGHAAGGLPGEKGPRSGPIGGKPGLAPGEDRPARTRNRYRYPDSSPLSLF